MFYVKRHDAGGDVLIACCDREILGKTLVDGELEVKISERFYGGEVVSGEQLMTRIRDATIVNIIGDRVVDLAVNKGLVEEDSVKTIGGVKHAQIIAIE